MHSTSLSECPCVCVCVCVLKYVSGNFGESMRAKSSVSERKDVLKHVRLNRDSESVKT